MYPELGLTIKKKSLTTLILRDDVPMIFVFGPKRKVSKQFAAIIE
jgi:hypothetical protein